MNRTAAISAGMILLFWGWVLAIAYAEQISHHGVAVNADALAENCLACHDGSVAHMVSFCTIRCDFKTSHSIMRPYPPPGRDVQYAPVSSLKSKGVRLQNNRVTCLSCHNLKNPAKKHLVVKSRENLCTLCHTK